MRWIEPVQREGESDADFAARIAAFGEAVDAEIDRRQEEEL